MLLESESLFLHQLSFACNSASCFNMRKKLWRHKSLFSICFCFPRKYPNNDNKIWSLPPSACFQQSFHDWFSVIRCNSDPPKLEWTPLFYLTLTKSVICRIKIVLSIFLNNTLKLAHCHLFLSSHVFTALEFDSKKNNKAMWLPWNQIGKTFLNNKRIKYSFVMSRK